MAGRSTPVALLDSEADSRYRIDVSKVEPRVLRRITAMAFGHPVRMALAMTAAVLAGSFQLFVPQFLGRAVDQAQGLLTESAAGAGRAAAEEALLVTAGLLVGASILRGLCTMMQNYQGEAVGQLIGYRLRLAYYRKLQTLSQSLSSRFRQCEPFCHFCSVRMLDLGEDPIRLLIELDGLSCLAKGCVG